MNDRALKTSVFYCSHHLEPGHWSLLRRTRERDTLQTISLPCSGKLDIPYLMKAFEAGADGVAIVTCKKGECRHFEGNLRARKRAEGVEALLEEIGVSAGRVAVFECGQETAQATLDAIGQFFDRLRALPPVHTQGSQAQPQECTAV
jgi:F420-non-reducing hydrogenase iron-sulfur subunit